MSEDLTQKLPIQPNDKLDQLFQMVQVISTELADLKQTVDARLYDTRPLGSTLEQIRADIAQLQEGQRRLQEGQDQIQSEVKEIRTWMRDMNRKLSIFNDTLVQIQADYRDIYDRVRGLEKQRA